MLSILYKDAQISELETPIVHLRQKLVRVKAERNELTPLLRLPDELQARIAVSFVLEILWPDLAYFNRLSILTSICHRLRSPCLNTPELWAFLNAGWAMRVIEHLLEHASPYPIYLIVEPRQLSEGVMRQCLPHAGTLNITVHDIELEWVDEALPQTLLSLLDTCVPDTSALEIQGGERGWMLAGEFLHPGSCATSTSVTLMETGLISALPPLPALKTLEVHGSIDLKYIHKCLMGSGMVEWLSVHGIEKWAHFHENEICALPKLSSPIRVI